MPNADWCGNTAGLRDLLNFAGADAGGANADALAGAIDKGADRLQVEIPTALGDVVGVANAVAEFWAPTAYFTNLCHKTKLSSVNRKN